MGAGEATRAWEARPFTGFACRLILLPPRPSGPRPPICWSSRPGRCGGAAYGSGLLSPPLSVAVATALAAEGPADVFALAAWPANASLSLRTTGASIVDDADRTNSPISPSLAMTALLSTPNSLASSYTRTFATALLAYSARLITRASQPDRSGLLRPALIPAVHRRKLIERSLQSQPVSLAARPADLFPFRQAAPVRCTARVKSAVAQVPSGGATRLSPAMLRPRGCSANACRASVRYLTSSSAGAGPGRRRSTPAGWPGGAWLVPSSPGWGCRYAPRPGSALRRRRELSHSR